jgi:hypothetical protein
MTRRAFAEEAKVTKTGSTRWAPRTVIVALIALAFGLADVRQSYAGCGGYCKARQVRALCNHAVKVQGLKAHKRDIEFEKCKADPVSYLTKPVTGGAEIGSE